MASKVAPFAGLRGKVADDKIAEMAGVKVETVTRYWRTIDDADEVSTDPDEPAQTAPAPEVVPDPVSEPHAATVPAGRRPSVVRVVRSARITDPDGRPWRVGLRDVFRGARAAWLWEHHRDLVEPYARP